jgi:hypothetical protein
MTVERPQIDRAACPASRTEDVEPWRSGEQRGADGRRPQHVAAGGQAPIPAVDNKFCLKARGAVRLQLGGTSLDVEPARPDSPAQNPRQ